MHLRVHIDPHQSSRSERESSRSTRQRAAIDVRHVSNRRHDRRAGSVERRRSTDSAVEKKLGRNCLHQARLQRQHSRVQIARGEDSVRQPHYAGRQQVTSSR